MYLDSAYIAKFYVNETDSPAVRRLIHASPEALYSSALAIAEVHCVLHRHVREGRIAAERARDLGEAFSLDCRNRLWNFSSVNDNLLRRAGSRVLSLSSHVYVRSADGVHLMTAAELGEHEIWTSDRHMLAAAAHFGLKGRSVQQ